MSDIAQDEWIRIGPGVLTVSSPRIREPKTDPDVSRIAGRKVFVNDPLLVKLVMKHKSKNPDQPDQLLKNEAFIKDVQETFK